MEITLPEAKGEVTLPDVELHSAKVEVKGPEIETEDMDGSSKFKMPKFNLPKFGTGSSNVTAEIPKVQKDIQFDAKLNIPKATVDITAPEVEGQLIDLKITGPDGSVKGSKISVPSLGLSMPKVKGPDFAFSLSKPDMDITLPGAKAEITVPDVELPSAKVEVKGPEIETEGFDGSSKFKMPKFKLPSIQTGSSNITAEIPKSDKEMTFEAELNIPKATVEMTAPTIEVEGPSIDLKTTGIKGTGKGSKFEMPNMGIAMPKVKASGFDLSVSKPDVDITIPEAKAEVTLPDVELPSSKSKVKGPEIDLKVKDVKGSTSKFKMPTFKFPKFGTASPNISVEIPEVEKEIKLDGELTIPKATVDIRAPTVEIEGPSIDLKSTGLEGTGKGSKFKMPNLGISMPKVKGPDVDFSLSKPDVDITLPEAKTEVTVPDVELPSAKVKVKGPEIETEDFDGSSKFKMPKFKLPTFGTGSSNITAEIPEVDKEMTFDAELNIPKATVDITAPEFDVEGPSIDVKTTGIKGTGKGSKFEMPNLGISMPKIKGPDFDSSVSKPDVDITLPEAKAKVTLPDVEIPSAKAEVKGPEIDLKVKDVKGSPSKFKMPTIKFPKFGVALPKISVDIPEVEKEIQLDGELTIPKATVDITAPTVEIEGPSISLQSTELEGTGKGSKFKMPNLGISMPKVKGPDVDFSLSKPDVDITLPEAKTEVTVPDVELPSAKVEVKGPEIETEDFDSSSKFKMPKFKLPTFGTSSSNITAEIPNVDKEITFDAELNIPKATVDITAPEIEVEGTSIDVKTTGIKGTGKGIKFEMPNLGISMPKMKGPDFDLSVSKPDVDITLPAAKAKVTLPDVEIPSAKAEVKGPEIDLKVKDVKGSPSKFKMPTIKFPKFGVASPKISVDIPEVEKEIQLDGELTIPKTTVDITAPTVEIEGPSISLQSTELEGTGKGSKFKMPNLGISMPKVKGPDVDFSLSKPDVDITLPEAKTEVTVPDVELPSAKVEVKGPEIETEDFDSSSKFKMPKFKLPTFGTGSSNITAEIPNVDKEITFDAELNIPKATVDITAPEIEVEGTSIDVKTTGMKGTGKGSMFEMPNLGISMPKMKGPDFDLSVSKPDVDITLPEAKAKVTLPDVEIPSAKAEVKGPEIDLKVKDVKGCPSKFKMPTIKFPKFGVASPKISGDLPEVEKEIQLDGELTIPKATVDITAPTVEIEGPSISIKSTELEGTGKGSKFKMPNLGISMPKVKGPDVDFSLSKPDVDITLPTEVTVPDVELPSAKVEVKGPEIETEDFDSSSKFKMPKFKLPTFGTGSSNITAEIPTVDKEITFDAELNIPKATVDITAPEIEVEGTSIDVKTTGMKGAGKGSKFEMPNLGISMPKMKGPDFDLSVSKPDVDITLPEAKAKVTLPDVEIPSAKAEVKGPEIDLKVKDVKGSPSKFKMPTIKFPKFGVASPKISGDLPEVEKEIQLDGELTIPKATVDITAPTVEIEGPSISIKSTELEGTGKGSKFKMPNLGISMPKVKGPDVDFSLSKPDVDITLPEAKTEVTVPDVELPSAKVEVKGPEIETEDFDSSSKFKMPKFKLPTFGTGSSNITAEIPTVDKEITFDAELNIPKATVDITAPEIEVEGTSIDVKTTGMKGAGKGSKFEMPNLGISMPKMKGPDFDLSVSKPDVDITLPEAKAKVTLPDVEIPSAKAEVKGPEIDLKVKDVKGSPSKFKMPTIKFPKFGVASPKISGDLPEVEKEIQLDGELTIPKATVDITAPTVEIDGPSISIKSTELEGTGKGSKFKMPNLGISMPKVKGPDVDFSLSKPDVDITLPEAKTEVTVPDVEVPSAKVEVKGPEIGTEDFDSSSKFKMPKFKLPTFGTGSSNITAEIPNVDKEMTFDAELNIPKATVDITAPEIEVEGPSIDVKTTGIKGTGKGSKFEMPNLGISMPKMKGPDFDLSVSKPDVDITLPEAKAKVTLPDVEIPSAKAEVKGPEIDLKVKDVKGSSSKFKMPTFKFPKFGAASPNVTVEIADIDKEIEFDGEMAIPKATVDITTPNVEIEGPSIDPKCTGLEGTGKGSKFKMPNLGISMPKVKGPDVDFSLSKPDVDITLPEAKAEMTLPDVELPSAKVEVKGPEIETEDFDGSSKFKMPKFKLPTFGTGSSNITAEIPEVDKEMTFDAELNIPKATVDITAPEIDVEGPSIDVKTTGIKGTGKGSKFEMPNLGISMPKIKGPDFDFSVSKPDVDITLPEAKAKVSPPDVELPSAKAEVKGPEIDLKVKDVKGSSSKFKMPTFKFPKFGAASPNVTVEIADIDKEIEFDGEMAIPKATVDITTPNVEIEGPSIDLKSTGLEGTGKGSKFKMPNLGISIPKVKGPDVDVSLSKPDVDITLPEAKAKVTLPDVEIPSAKAEVKVPEIDVKVKDVKGSPSKFKMPTIKFPKFGAASPNISVDIPEVEKEIQLDGELTIPKATLDITVPTVEIEGPSVTLKSTGLEGTGKGSKFKMPNLGISMPKVKGPDVDVSLSKPDVDITLPEAKVEVTVPDVELPSAKVEVKGPEIETEDFEVSSKFKMPKFKLPTFGTGSSNITAAIPEVDKEMTFDAELNIPKATVDITAPEIDVEGPSIDVKTTGIKGTGKGSKFEMPNLGISMPKMKGPEFDLRVSKPDVDITLPEAKAKVTLPDVEIPSAKAEVKGPEIDLKVKDVKGSSSKFKMPTFKFPKFGAGSPNVTVEIADVDKEIEFNGEMAIPKATVDITTPNVEIEGPSIDLKSTGVEGTGKGSKFKMPNLGISMPKVKGPDVDVSLSKPDVDITLPEAKVEVTVPDVELPSAKVEVKGPEIETEDFEVSSKFKMTKFKLPTFGTGSSNITAAIPEVDKEMTFDAELNIPKATVEMTAPKIEVEGPSIDVKTKGFKGTGKGSKFEMPNLGISMPKVKGPDFDFSVSKPDVDITLPEAKAKVTLPDVEIPSAKAEVKVPEIDVKVKDVKGSPSKFKMPTITFPKFGAASPNISVDIPEVEKEIQLDGELTIPKATLEITAPTVEIEGPSLTKSTGLEGTGKGSKFKMPNLGISMPKVKGPDVDVSLSKPDVDITLPEAKVEVTVPDVELPSAKVEIKGPEIDLKVKDVKGSSSKFKMPTFKFPKFGAASPNVTVEIADVDKDIEFDGEMAIPKATLDITTPNVEIEGPSIDLKSAGLEGTGKGSKFKMPNLGISMPKVKGPDVDFSLPKPDVDITLPEAKAEITLPDVELPSAKVEVKGPEIETEDSDGSAKFTMPKFKLPTFGTGSSNITAEIPEVDKEMTFDAELNIPKATVEITAPKIEVEGPSIDVKTKGIKGTGKGSKFEMPNLGISMPKVKGPDFDFSVSKPDVDIPLPEAKAKVTLPDVEIPSAKAEVKVPEIDVKVKDVKGSPSKFKMPTIKFPKFGVASPNISVDIPEVEKEIQLDGELTIPKATLDITSPTVEIEGPSVTLKSTGLEGTGKGSKFKMPNLGISMPKVKGPDVDVSLSKPDGDITLPEAEVEVTVPDVELPSSKVDVKGPEIDLKVKDGKGSPSKFKMPTFKFPKFGAASPNISVEIPNVEKEIQLDGELIIPKAAVDITAPNVEIEGPSIDLKSTGLEGTGKGSKFKMPNLGISMPKVKGPDVDFSLSKPDVDITLPEAKTEVTVPDVELPSAKVEVKGPEIETEDFDGSSKFKMPKFKLPKFGTGSTNITAEIPEVDKEITFDAELNITKAMVNITAPKVEVEGPSIDLKTTGIEGTAKGSKFGPDVDLSVSKLDVDITLPEAKADVTQPYVELPSGPETGMKVMDAEVLSSTFKMPSHGIFIPKVKESEIDVNVSKNIVDATLPEASARLKCADAEVKALAEIANPEACAIEDHVTVKQSGWSFPSFSFSKTQVKGQDINASIASPQIDVRLTDTKAEIHPSHVEIKGPTNEILTEELPSVEPESNLKKTKFSLPRFSFSKASIKDHETDANPKELDSLPRGKMEQIEVSEVEREGPEIEGHLEVTTPSFTVEAPSVITTKTTGTYLGRKDIKFKKPETVTLPELDLNMSKTDTFEGKEATVDVEVRKASATLTALEDCTPEEDIKVKKPWFSLPRFSFSKQGVKETDIQSAEMETELNAEGSGIATDHLASPNVTAEVVKQDKETKTSEQNRPVDIKVPSHDIKTAAPNTDSQHSQSASPDNGSPSKFKLPSFKMPRLSFSKAKPENEYLPVDTECEDDQLEIKIEPQVPDKSLKTSFGPMLKPIDDESNVSTPEGVDGKPAPSNDEMAVPNKHIIKSQPQNQDDTLEMKGKLTFKLPAFGLSPSSEGTKTVADSDVAESSGTRQQSEAVEKEPEVRAESVRSPERVGWFKFPRFGLSSPEKSLESPDEDLSTACSLQSSDAFGDASSMATSEQTGVSFTSPAKVTVKYSSPDAAVELGEIHSNIITSTTRSAQISFEPNLPEKITILSAGVSSSSVDTLKLESDKIHVIRSNIQATPQVLQSTILTNFQVQSPLEIPMNPEFREAVSWSVGELQEYQGITSVERHITREISRSQETTTVSRGTVVTTQQLTRRVDQVEPISDETASSIQRLRDTVHSEKMRFFDGAQP
ncbi:Neuroblast differentiation-associated protein AHNAK [Merluccius polli]|uniref:Neuroblast differentiation-associated protein AHNAK n=1 Tax=Merluccius polli TaxID=89951 RepID=A0AA47MFR5_MERPO|nr:Neuroblast differentiation-associated protein AHNAK [Merluccius polli]